MAKKSTSKKAAAAKRKSAPAAKRSVAKNTPVKAKASARSSAPRRSAAAKTSPVARTRVPRKPPAPPALAPATTAALEKLRARLGAQGIDEVLTLLIGAAHSLKAMPTADERLYVVPLDCAKKSFLFANSENAGMRNWLGTEVDLLVALSSATAGEIPDSAIIANAAVIQMKRDLGMQARIAQHGSARGFAGAADERLEQAYQQIIVERPGIAPEKIPAQLKRLTGTGFRTCQRFLVRRGILPRETVSNG